MDLIQIGMLVSTDPNPNLNTKGIIRERGFLDTNQTFEVMMMGLEKGTKYFYRTYAMNAEGVGYGVVKDFVMQEHARGPSWAKAQPGAAANWWTSPWFGSFLYERWKCLGDAFRTGLVVSNGKWRQRSMVVEGTTRLVVDR